MSNNLEVKATLDGPSVTEAITKAILDSVLGQEIEKEVKSYVSKLHNSYNSPLESTVKRIVDEELYKVITMDYMDQIRAVIREKVDEKMVSIIVEKAWESFEKRW